MLHADELPIHLEMVRQLLDSQFPQHRALPLVPLTASGSSNRLFRLGDDLLVRLPRQPGGGATLVKEQRWQELLAQHLAVAIPRSIALGEPDATYPEPWSLVEWLNGEPPATQGVAIPSQGALATELAAELRRLWAIPVPSSALTQSDLQGYRGQPLAKFSPAFERSLARCLSANQHRAAFALDVKSIEAVWAFGLQQPGADIVEDACWFHSDIVAENLLLRDGSLAAVLDFGGLGVGDTAIDLHGAWELFAPSDRQAFREATQVSNAVWYRARAWAVAVALMTLDYYAHSMPQRVAARQVMLDAVLADVAANGLAS